MFWMSKSDLLQFCFTHHHIPLCFTTLTPTFAPVLVKHLETMLFLSLWSWMTMFWIICCKLIALFLAALAALYLTLVSEWPPHKVWLLRLETLQTFEQSDVWTKDKGTKKQTPKREFNIVTTKRQKIQKDKKDKKDNNGQKGKDQKEILILWCQGTFALLQCFNDEWTLTCPQ